MIESNPSNNSILHDCFIKSLNDKHLSWKAKGLFCFLVNSPNFKTMCIDELKNHSSDGRDGTNTALNELIKHGYVLRKVNRGERGQFKGYTYSIFEK